MKLFLIVLFCSLLVAFAAEGAFKAGKSLQQKQHNMEERIKRLT